MGSGEKVIKSIDGRKVRYKLGPEVDASGKLRTGESFDGYVQFRDQLAKKEDVIARTLITKLMTFATGRELGFSDRASIDKMVAASKRNGHRVKDLIELVVTSALFRHK